MMVGKQDMEKAGRALCGPLLSHLPTPLLSPASGTTRVSSGSLNASSAPVAPSHRANIGKRTGKGKQSVTWSVSSTSRPSSWPVTMVVEDAWPRQCLAILRSAWPSSSTTRRGALAPASFWATFANEIGAADVAMVGKKNDKRRESAGPPEESGDGRRRGAGDDAESGKDRRGARPHESSRQKGQDRATRETQAPSAGARAPSRRADGGGSRPPRGSGRARGDGARGRARRRERAAPEQGRAGAKGRVGGAEGGVRGKRGS